MIVIVRNKVFSLAGSSTVKDEAGNDVFRVKGKLRLFSPTRKKKIYDMNKNLLYVVRNKWFNWFLHRAFIFDGHKNKICTLKNQIRVKGKKFIVENSEDEISIDGNFMNWNLEVMKNGERIATIKREFDVFDRFRVEASEGDMPFVVALVIAMDNINDKRTST